MTARRPRVPGVALAAALAMAAAPGCRKRAAPTVDDAGVPFAVAPADAAAGWRHIEALAGPRAFAGDDTALVAALAVVADDGDALETYYRAVDAGRPPEAPPASLAAVAADLATWADASGSLPDRELDDLDDGIATHARDALALFRAGRAVLAGTGRDAPDGVGDVLYLAARMRIEGRSLLVVTVGLELARSAADRAAALGVDLPALDDLAPRDADVVHALAAEALFSRALIAADRAGAAPSLSAADAAALDAGWRVALDGATLDDPRDQVLERVRRAGAMPAVRRVKTLDLGGMRSTLARAYQAIDAYRDAAARARAAAAP